MYMNFIFIYSFAICLADSHIILRRYYPNESWQSPFSNTSNTLNDQFTLRPIVKEVDEKSLNLYKNRTVDFQEFKNAIISAMEYKKNLEKHIANTTVFKSKKNPSPPTMTTFDEFFERYPDFEEHFIETLKTICKKYFFMNFQGKDPVLTNFHSNNFMTKTNIKQYLRNQLKGLLQRMDLYSENTFPFINTQIYCPLVEKLIEIDVTNVTIHLPAYVPEKLSYKNSSKNVNIVSEENKYGFVSEEIPNSDYYVGSESEISGIQKPVYEPSDDVGAEYRQLDFGDTTTPYIDDRNWTRPEDILHSNDTIEIIETTTLSVDNRNVNNNSISVEFINKTRIRNFTRKYMNKHAHRPTIPPEAKAQVAKANIEFLKSLKNSGRNTTRRLPLPMVRFPIMKKSNPPRTRTDLFNIKRPNILKKNYTRPETSPEESQNIPVQIVSNNSITSKHRDLNKNISNIESRNIDYDDIESSEESENLEVVIGNESNGTFNQHKIKSFENTIKPKNQNVYMKVLDINYYMEVLKQNIEPRSPPENDGILNSSVNIEKSIVSNKSDLIIPTVQLENTYNSNPKTFNISAKQNKNSKLADDLRNIEINNRNYDRVDEEDKYLQINYNQNNVSISKEIAINTPQNKNVYREKNMEIKNSNTENRNITEKPKELSKSVLFQDIPMKFNSQPNLKEINIYNSTKKKISNFENISTILNTTTINNSEKMTSYLNLTNQTKSEKYSNIEKELNPKNTSIKNIDNSQKNISDILENRENPDLFSFNETNKKESAKINNTNRLIKSDEKISNVSLNKTSIFLQNPRFNTSIKFMNENKTSVPKSEMHETKNSLKESVDSINDDLSMNNNSRKFSNPPENIFLNSSKIQYNRTVNEIINKSNIVSKENNNTIDKIESLTSEPESRRLETVEVTTKQIWRSTVTEKSENIIDTLLQQ